jgi:hypothetical protein
MTEFKIQCDYSRKKKMKFFNDQEPKEYHGFLVYNPEIIPDEYLYSAKNKRQKPCWIWMLDDLVKKTGIDFGDPSDREQKDYKFVINLGGAKVAKFNTNNRNWMVLKTQEYFENTIQKIGFWDSENYFYESKKRSQKPSRKQNNSPNQPENKNGWGKITLICLPILATVFLSLLIIKWASKRKKQ